MRKPVTGFFIFTIILFFITSCGRKKEEEKPLPDEAYLKLADTLQYTLNFHTPYFLGDRFDKELFLSKISSANQLGANERINFLKELSARIDLLGKEIQKQVNEGGGYRFLRLKKENGENRLLFAAHVQGGINYHEYLVKPLNGRPFINDIYVYLNGQLLSETYNSALEGLLKDKASGPFSSFVGKKQVNPAILEKYAIINEARELAENGSLEEAWQKFNSIPDSLKRRKEILLVKLSIATLDSVNVYMAVIDEYQKRFPQDPALDLICLDGLFAHGDYNGVLKAIDRLDKQVKDPYLDYYRANVFIQKADYPSSLQCMNRVIKNFPGKIKDSYMSAALMYSILNKTDSAIVVLTKYAADKKIFRKQAAHEFEAFGNSPYVKKVAETKEFKAFSQTY